MSHIRTIKFYALHNWRKHEVVKIAQFKYQLQSRKDCVIVNCQGTYARPRKSTKEKS